jgi:hypothetical protein
LKMNDREKAIAAAGIGATPYVASQFALKDLYTDMYKSRIRNSEKILMNKSYVTPLPEQQSSIASKLQEAMGTREKFHYDSTLSSSKGPFYLPNDLHIKIGPLKGSVVKQGIHLPYSKVDESNVGIISHELGHAKDYMTLNKPNILAKATKGLLGMSRVSIVPGAIASTLLTATAPDDNTSIVPAAASALAAAPALAEEASATIRGIKGLSKVYGGLGKALTHGGLKAIRVNSLGYLPLVGAPLFTYMARKMLTKKEDK